MLLIMPYPFTQYPIYIQYDYKDEYYEECLLVTEFLYMLMFLRVFLWAKALMNYLPYSDYMA